MNWQPIVLELRKWGTLREVAKIVGTCESRLVQLAGGYEWSPRFDQAMKMLALYDRVADKAETGRAVDHFQLWAVAGHQSLKRTPRGRKRMAGNRASDVQPVRPEAATGPSFDRLIHDLECGEGAGR